QLRGPRPNFLQLLAQPEMAVMLDGRGTGPYRIAAGGNAPVRLSPPPLPDDDPGTPQPDILLWGQRPALAVARFAAGDVELVTGGTIGDLAYARTANLRRAALTLDN